MSKNTIRNLMVGLVGLLLLVFAFLSWYKYQYSMEVVESGSMNDPSSAHHVLIATQGSPFKNALADELVNNLKNRDVFLQIIDVTKLPEINESEWSAIVIIHTWEYFEPHPEAKSFVNDVANKDKLVVVTTSGEGKLTLKNVDGISSASQMDEIENLSREILDRVDNILQ